MNTYRITKQRMLGKTLQRITSKTHYVLFREFSWLRNNKQGDFAFFLITFKLLHLLLSGSGSSNLNPKSINTSAEGSVNDSIQNTSSVTPA